MISTRTPLVLCICLLLSACSGGQEGAPSASSVPEASATAEDGARGSKDARSPGDRKKPSGEGKGKGSDPATSGEGDQAGSEEPPGGDGDDETDLSTASAAVRDTGADAEVHGDAPGYAELTGASVEGLGRTVRLRVSLAETVPRALEEDAFMVVEIRIEHERREYSVYANGTEQGWEGFVSDGESSRRARGFRLEGNDIIWEPRWSEVGGPSRFTWYGGLSWTRPTLTRTHYAFDSAPNDYQGHFPDRG